MIAPETEIGIQQNEDDPQLRDLFSFSAGGRMFAVFADHVEGTADNKRAAPLPNAPVAVLGVVCVRGRMMTVLDPVALVTGVAHTLPSELPCVVALRGDEQLALAAETSGDTVTILATDLEPPESADNAVIAGIAQHGGEKITVLDTKNLFFAAVQRKERRRRRF